MGFGIVFLVLIFVTKWYEDLYNEDSSPQLLQLHPSRGDDDIPVIHIDSEGQWREYIESVDEFIEGYTSDARSGEHFYFCRQDLEVAPEHHSCFFDIKYLHRCSWNGGDDYGYAAKQPCVYLSTNKLNGWKPEYYGHIAEIPEEAPRELLNVMNQEAGPNGELSPRLWVSCQGKDPADRESIGSMDYYPHPYFFPAYFPYREGRPYHAPVVAIKFRDIAPHVLIHVVCRIWAKNVEELRSTIEWQMLID